MQQNTPPAIDDSYRMLLELAVDAFFQGDLNGNLIMVNSKAIDLTGYSREELIGMNLSQLFSGDTLNNLPLRYDLLEKGETVRYEREILRKDGGTVRVEMHSKKMPDGTYQSFFRDITDRSLAASALEKSETRYRRLLSSMTDGFVITDMEGRIIESNPAYQEMLGYSQEELSRLTYFDLTPEKWHAYEQEIVRTQIFPNNHSVIYQKEYIRKDGTAFPIELRTSIILNDSGEREGMWAIIRDITERKRTEERLKESEEKYRGIVESSPTAMHFYRLDENGELIFTGANPAADRILRIEHAPLAGKVITGAFPNLAATTIPGLYYQVATGSLGPQSFEIPYADERFSGYYFVHVFRNGYNSITVDFLDISQRRNAEEALRRSEVEYRETLDSLPEWIYVIDRNMKFIVINASLADRLRESGFTKAFTGEALTEEDPFFTAEDILSVSRVFETGKLEIRRQSLVAGGKEYHLEITTVPIHKEGLVEKVIVVMRDRSEEKEIEDLRQRNTDQKEVLLREIHHRVKNNMAIIASLLNFQQRATNTPGLDRILLDIQMRIRSMSLIHEHLYRSESLDRIPLADYIHSLSTIILSTFSGNKAQLDTSLEKMDAMIETALPIGLIINELLTNAFKYAFPNGAEGTIGIGLSRLNENDCLLVVSDNGVGLPDSIGLHSEKTLGLYIVGLLTEQIDGKTTIDRSNGTTFHVRFRNRTPGNIPAAGVR